MSYAALCSQKYQSEERRTRPFNVAGQAEPVAVEIFDRQFAGRLLTGLFECDRRQRTIGLVLAGRANRKHIAVPVRQHVRRNRQADLQRQMAADIGYLGIAKIRIGIDADI